MPINILPIMKKIIFLTIVFILLLNFSKGQQPAPAFAVTYKNATDAVNTLAGSNIVVSNATLTHGDAHQLATATTSNSHVGITNGILLTTGDANFAGTDNTSNVGDALPIVGGVSFQDPDLQLVKPGTQFSTAILEFDFSCIGSIASFIFVFLSEEYNKYSDGALFPYHDQFAFFVSGTGINGPYSNNAENFALVSGAPNSTPISVTTVSGCTNSAFYNNNAWNDNGLHNSSQCLHDCNASSFNDHSIPYNGFTKKLQVNIPLSCQANVTYHCKLAIANIADNIFDSGVILEASSLTSNWNIGEITADIIPICEGHNFNLTIQGDPSLIYSWSTGQSGVGLASISTVANYTQNNYSVTISDGSGCSYTVSKQVDVSSANNLPPYTNGFNNSGNFTYTMRAGINYCVDIPSFDPNGDDVILSSTSLPLGSTINFNSQPLPTATFCWTPQSTDIGFNTFILSAIDQNDCIKLTVLGNYTIKVICNSCQIDVDYENRTPSNNPLPAFTKTGNSTSAGITAPVSTGSSFVTFKAPHIYLGSYFNAGPGFIATPDDNTCVNDCEDCCSHFSGITHNPIPSAFTPNGDGYNDTWWVGDTQNPDCSFGGAYGYHLEIFDPWGDLLYEYDNNSNSCCHEKTFLNSNGVATGSTLNWNGYTNHSNFNTCNGCLVHNGTYYYILTIYACTNQSFTGYLEVLASPARMTSPDSHNTFASINKQDTHSNDTSIFSESVNNPDLHSKTKAVSLFKIYPNPAIEKLYIETSDELIYGLTLVTIYDALGVLVYQKSINENIMEIFLGNISSGPYWVTFFNEKYFESKLFIKN